VDDDLNVAIKVLLNSFITAQKFSVSETLKKNFRKYVTHGKDHRQLLLLFLNKLTQRNVSVHPNRADPNLSSIDIECDDFETMAREVGITSELESFYRSDLFKNNNFSLNTKKRIIIKKLI